MLERLGHASKRSTVAKTAGFALHQADVVLPVIKGLTALKAATVPGYPLAIGHHSDVVVVHAHTDGRVGVLGRYAVAIALQVDQAGARYTCQ